jgi:hypothetical protein
LFKNTVNNLPQFNTNASNISELEDRAFQYANDCIKALFKSTTAFHNLGDPATTRLMVTNIWGTAHAYVSSLFPTFLDLLELISFRQWGNVLTLHAVFNDAMLKNLIDRDQLKDLTTKTIGFLSLASQPSSALTTDLKILKHTAEKIGLFQPSG